MQGVSDREAQQEVACPLYFIAPDEEPELHMPQDEVRIEQAFLTEAGETERSFSGNTAAWD